MKKRALIGIGILSAACIMTACTYTADPNKKTKDNAIDLYKKHYAAHKDEEQEPLFYFDLSTLKGTKVEPTKDGPKATYLGQLNVSNFTFSEDPDKYFVDLGNLPIHITTDAYNSENNAVKIADFLDTSKEEMFDAKAFAKNLPFILNEVEIVDGKKQIKDRYSGLNEKGEIPATANVKDYNSELFFISDMVFDIAGAQIEYIIDKTLTNYANQDLAVLRKDIINFLKVVIDEATDFTGLNISALLDFDKIFGNSYRKANNIFDNEKPNQETLYFPGFHTTLEDGVEVTRKVVPGPNGALNDIFKTIFGTDSEIADDLTPAIWDYENIILGEGITRICFHAFEAERDEEGNSTSKLRNIYLPSTLQDMMFGAFSNLDLDSLVIPRTWSLDDFGNILYRAFDTVNFEGVRYQLLEGLEKNVYPSFFSTTFAKILFEDCANENILNFPYYTTGNNSEEKLEEVIQIYHDLLDTTKFKNLKDAFVKYSEVNPYSVMDLAESELGQVSLTSGIESIPFGKTLNLPSNEFILEEYNREVSSHGDLENKDSTKYGDEAKLKLVLDRDLELGGTLNLGSQIGITEEGTGASTGEFAALDLAGHKLTVKDTGILNAYGIIFDSSADKTGEVILEDGAKLNTNFTIEDYTGLEEMNLNAENNLKLFDSYSLSSLKTKVVANKGATISTTLDAIDGDNVLESNFDFIGREDSETKPLIEINEGKVTYDYNVKSINSPGKVTINNVSLIHDGEKYYYTNDHGFSLSGDNLSVSFEETNLKTKIVETIGDVNIKKLHLFDGAVFFSREYNLTISGSVSHDGEGSYGLSGRIKSTSAAFDAIVEEININENLYAYNYVYEYLTKEEGEYEIASENFQLGVLVGVSENDFVKFYSKFDNGYYYLYENDYKKGGLITSEGKTIASYDRGIHWTAYYEGAEEGINTYVLTVNRTLTTFYPNATEIRILSNSEHSATWSSVSTINDDKTYTIDGAKYIQLGSTQELKKGNFVTDAPVQDKIFALTNGDKYFAIDNLWYKISTYDRNFNFVLEEGPKMSFAFIGQDFGYVPTTSYDKTQHLSDLDGVKYVFGLNSANEYQNLMLSQGESIDWSTRRTISDFGDDKFFVSSEGLWRVASVIGTYYAKSDDISFFYFKSLNRWLKGLKDVAGQSKGNYYSQYVDTTFGVLDAPIVDGGKSYRFIHRVGNDINSEYKLLNAQGYFKITTENYPEVFSEKTGTLRSRKYFFGYRYFMLGNDKYLYFYNNETGEYSRRKFEFAPLFSPADAATDPDANIITKYDFMKFKVKFYENETDETPKDEIETIYIFVGNENLSGDNAIIAGERDEESDRYLAIAIFSYDNPIDRFVQAAVESDS